MSSTPADLKTLLFRDLSGMQAQILDYSDEADIWKLAPGINNSAGSLVLHCVGNLRHFVGAALGQTGYERDRDREFSSRNIPREELLQLLDAAKEEVDRGLNAISPQELGAIRGLPGEKSCSQERFLHHLCTHLAYHLGQMDYHRRILTGGGPLPGILGLGALDPGETI